MHEMEFVHRLSSNLSKRIGNNRFDLWFGKLSQLKVQNQQVLVLAQSAFVRDWIRSNFATELRQAINDAADGGGRVELQFSLEETDVTDKNPQSSMPAAEACSSSLEKSTDASHGGQRAAAGGTSQSTDAVNPNPYHSTQVDTGISARDARRPTRRFESFTTFVSGVENSAGVTAARFAADRPGQTSPILIHGPTATGKTHLLEAIRTQLRREHPQGRLLYLTSEQFTSGYVDAAQRRELPSFRGKYRVVDCLLLDDIHFLIGKSGTTGELLYTVDTLIRAGKQVVLTADRPPSELAGLGEELLSRVSAGLVTHIDPPGYEIRLGVARRTARDLDFPLTEEILSTVAMQVTGDCRSIIGAVNRLYAHSLTSQRPLTQEEAEGVLAEIAHQNTPAVRLPDIERAVCHLFGIDAKTLKSGRRSRSVSDPRTLAMWLARKYTRAALGEIGTFFGRRSHSTVISAGRKVERWLSNRAQINVGNHNCTADEAIRRIESALRRA